MEIREELLQELSKGQTLALVDHIGSDPERMADLMRFFLGGDDRAHQRAGWVASHVADVRPQLLIPYQEELLKKIDHPGHPGIRRNALRVLCRLSLPEELWGEAYDRATGVLANPRLPVALHRFAMELAWNICQEVPELAEELRILIDDGMEHGSPGFTSYGGKVLKWIDKLQ